MNKRILSICKPSYNRKDVLIPDIKEYLKLDDDRLEVKVNDNCSTDGTIEELNKISDERLKFIVNKKNIGGIPNMMLSLTAADTQYVMLVIDKDTIDIKVLPQFLDYLENEQPYFGFIDFKNNQSFKVEKFKAGIDCILHTGFLSKHPSGLFWRTSLLEGEMKKNYYKNIDPFFAFIFDVICGKLGAKYDSQIIYMPLIINANLRSKIGGEKYSKTLEYNGDKAFFNSKMRTKEFSCYLKNALEINLPRNDLKILCKHLTDSGIRQISINVRKEMRNKTVCAHYNLQMRNIGLKEMIKNTLIILHILSEYATNVLGKKYIRYISVHLFIKSVFRDIKILIRDLIITAYNGLSV
jgi:glycosyltransferase involved in cell wall biosynthesis